VERAGRDFRAKHPGITIEWDRRSLKDFGDYPIIPLAQRYDLIMMDYPFTGTALASKALVALEEYVPADYLEDQRGNSVGRSCQSYNLGGHQLALAVDAACQVSVLLRDVMDRLGVAVPSTWDQVFEAAKALPPDHSIAIPWEPTGAYCSFVSLCANIGGDGIITPERGLDPDVGEEAARLMQRLTKIVHPTSFYLNPIKLMDFMEVSDEIVYVPLCFGYSNYARTAKAGKVLDFANIPGKDGKPSGSILGGVGLAVSEFSRNIPAAVEFAMMVAGGEYQRTAFFEAGGQPGHRSAWVDPDVNKASNNYFADTLDTLDQSYLRPRYVGYDKFQVQAGDMMHNFLKDSFIGGGGKSAREIVKDFNACMLSEIKGG